MTNRKVSFPDELIINARIESTIFNPMDQNTGVAILSEFVDKLYTLRVYELNYDKKEKIYFPVQELAAFSFEERYELEHFMKRLPSLNGIEMLFLLNPNPMRG